RPQHLVRCRSERCPHQTGEDQVSQRCDQPPAGKLPSQLARMLHTILDFIRTLTDPERLIDLLSTLLSGWLGYATLFAIVYSETGLLVGFFLPGDSLLFTVGVVAGAGQLDIVLVIALLSAAAILGDSTAFLLG